MTKQRTTLSDLIATSRKIISAEGLLVVSTGGSGVVASYTIGLTTRLGYELFVVGPAPEAALRMLNALADQLLKLDIEDGVVTVAGTQVRLAFLPKDATDSTTKRLRMIPEVGYQPQRIRQVLITDPAGLFPDDPGHALAFRQTLDAAGL